MQATVTILLSDKRSGSTLLEQELCKHSAVNHVKFSPHTYNETHYWTKAACLLPVAKAGFYGKARPTNYGSPSLVTKSLVNFLKRNIPDFVMPETDEALVFDGWNALCRQFARPVFFEKSPQHPHHWAALELLLSWIRTTDYQVRVIGLVRNPMAVMHSALQLFYTDPQSRQFGWAQACRNILKFGDLLNDEQFRLVRYEDIVMQPKLEFEQLCDFIGIENESMLGQSVNSDSLNKWKDEQGFTLELDKVVYELARELGYSSEDLFNPPKSKPSYFKRVHLGLVLQANRYKSRAYRLIKRMKAQSGFSE